MKMTRFRNEVRGRLCKEMLTAVLEIRSNKRKFLRD